MCIDHQEDKQKIVSAEGKCRDECLWCKNLVDNGHDTWCSSNNNIN